MGSLSSFNFHLRILFLEFDKIKSGQKSSSELKPMSQNVKKKLKPKIFFYFLGVISVEVELIQMCVTSKSRTDVMSKCECHGVY